MGPVKARQALERLEPDRSALILISSGFAGALAPGVRRGDLVADLREAPLDFVRSAQSAAERLKTPLHLGAFLSADRVLNPAEKRDLGARNRALAVDMESGALREWTKAGGGTFMAVRAVLDELDDELPDDAPGEGVAQSLRFAAKHWRKLPALAALGLRQRRAMARLTAFMGEWLQSFSL